MLDMDQFIKIYAMEFFLKHWDGYADNTNNTYIYNDVDAVAAPGVGNIKFKMIPWGIDQTFQPDRPFKLGGDGVIAQLVRNDADPPQAIVRPDSGRIGRPCSAARISRRS